MVETVDDKTLISLFFARSEQAIAALDRAYGKLCRKVSGQFLADHRDVEECVSDSYLAVWNAIPPQEPNPLVGFLCAIVRRISVSRHRHNTAVKRSSQFTESLEELEHTLSSPDNPEAVLERKELTRALERFLDGQNRENRVIFLRRYWFADSIQQIARRVGLRENTVSVRLNRLRRELREYLHKEGLL